MMIDTRILWLWLHLIGVVIWAGGFFYLLMALVPALSGGQASEDRKSLIQQAIANFRRVSWIAIALIVVSGVMNILKRVDLAAGTGDMKTYMRILSIKLLIALALIVHQAVKLLEPKILPDGRLGFKSKAIGLVGAALFLVAMLLGIVMRTL